MDSYPMHEQIVEVKRRAPSESAQHRASVVSEHHRVRVVVDLADIARRYGPRASVQLSGKCRFLEGAVVIEHIGPAEVPAVR